LRPLYLLVSLDLNQHREQKCPHSSFPLGQGSIYDIEDAGRAGIRCFRHGWCFDLLTGRGDRGTVKLTLWDIELREPLISTPDGSGGKIFEGISVGIFSMGMRGVQV